MLWLETYLELCQTSKMECFVKIVNCYKPLTIFANSELHLRCLTGFWIRLCTLFCNSMLQAPNLMVAIVRLPCLCCKCLFKEPNWRHRPKYSNSLFQKNVFLKRLSNQRVKLRGWWWNYIMSEVKTGSEVHLCTSVPIVPLLNFPNWR